MNTVIPIKEPTASMGLIPATMAEALQLASMMANAKLVPAALQKSPADCLMVIQQAIRWELDPFAVAQECSVIQGKLMYGGKLVAAVINVRGGLAERLSFAYEGEGDDRTITVSGRIQGEAEPRAVAVRLRDAKTANKVWQTQPDQQLMYHGSRVWARRHAPELMLGVYSPEEFDEPAPLSSAAKRPSPPKPNVLLPPHDPQTGEVVDDPPEAEAATSAAVPAPVADDPSITELDGFLGEAAARGSKALKETWDALSSEQQKILRASLTRRHKPAAAAADAERMAND